jgi:hypothetical protein
MSVVTNITDDRKHLLEKRMLNQDQHQTLSPQQQHHSYKGLPVNSSKNEIAAQSTAAVLIDSSSKVDEKHTSSRTNGNTAGDSSGNTSLTVPVVAAPSIVSTVQYSAPTSSANSASIVELPFSDESKVSENSKSHSRSIHSPALKGEKDKENKIDNNSRNLKRQSHNSFENKSPKLSKNDENNPSDHISAVCAGRLSLRTDALNLSITLIAKSAKSEITDCYDTDIQSSQTRARGARHQRRERSCLTSWRKATTKVILCPHLYFL